MSYNYLNQNLNNNSSSLPDDRQAQQNRERDRNVNPERQQRLINNFNNLTNLNNVNLNPNSRINSSSGNVTRDGNLNIINNDQRTPIIRVPSRQREDFSQSNNINNNFNIPNSNFDEQFKQGNNFQIRDQDSLQQEMNGFKKLLKYIMESQTEMQRKIIDYNKYITEQENITRLNNLKINEHDSKLTEILITFNNYLKLNDNSTTIINNLTKNYENSVKKVELNEVKANLSEVNKNCDLRFGEFSIKYDHLINKYSEISK